MKTPGITCVHDYEELRKRVIDGDVGKSTGLAVVMSRGLTSWMQLVCETLAAPCSVEITIVPQQVVSSTSTTPSPLAVSTAVLDEMVHAFASMVLGSAREVMYGA